MKVIVNKEKNQKLLVINKKPIHNETLHQQIDQSPDFSYNIKHKSVNATNMKLQNAS